MLNDDLKKSNMQVCKFIEDLFFEKDAQHFAATQLHLQHLILFRTIANTNSSPGEY